MICGANIGTQEITITQILSPDDINLGTHLRMDSHKDTSCDNKHVFIESMIEGMQIDAVPSENLFKISVIYQSRLPYINMTTPIKIFILIYKSTM